MAESKGPLPPTGTFDPHSFDSAHPYPVPYNAKVNQRRSLRIRFLYASAVAALLWFMGATLFRSRVPFTAWSVGRGNYPIPPDIIPQFCVSHDAWLTQPPPSPAFGFPSAAAASFDLSLSAEKLLLLSRGPNGNVEIVTSAEQDKDIATIEVVVSYILEDARDDAKVCQVISKDGGLGVGIFTRQWWLSNEENELHFATKVILPELSNGSPLLINKFETDVHNFAHRVGDLNRKVLFQYLHLQGTNGRIDVESVKANQGTIETSNAGISGVYNASSLVLATRNGPVDADIELSSIDTSESKLVLATTNAAITSKISLISEKGQGGTFDVTTDTTNEPLDIDFPAAPTDSILKFAGKTSNARVGVSLNPAYEGSFVLKTTHFKPEVYLDESVIDPSGRDRKHALRIKVEEEGIALGRVFWDDATKEKGWKAGSVVIHTTNEEIDLNL